MKAQVQKIKIWLKVKYSEARKFLRKNIRLTGPSGFMGTYSGTFIYKISKPGFMRIYGDLCHP